MNTGASGFDLSEADARVHQMQTKLYQWSTNDKERVFSDLYNLVYDPAFLQVAWARVRGNRGARTPGVDGISPISISDPNEFLDELRRSLKQRQFTPTRVRERKIPKASGKMRRLGIPNTSDRVVQAALKLVLEPIFEADFLPCSYGFRPKRRAQDAIAEIHFFANSPRSYEWVFEGDIEACFDEIDHGALMARIRRRISDKRILTLIKAFLSADILSEEGINRRTITGTPQGGVLSPLLANIALSVLDEHFSTKWGALGSHWTRDKHKRNGGAVFRLIRYADDFVIMGYGARKDVELLKGEVSTVLSQVGLHLSESKTKICHIEEGFDFLGCPLCQDCCHLA